MNIVYDGTMEPRAFKDVIGQTIRALSAEDPDVIYLDADLMSCIGTCGWSAENPTRGINCGISESNMIGVACGLAATGYKPIVHTFGPFASRRVFDQVFLSAGYAKNDITVIGTDPGVCASFNGGTHMPFEDVALYRTIPTATIIDITDANMLMRPIRPNGEPKSSSMAFPRKGGTSPPPRRYSVPTGDTSDAGGDPIGAMVAPSPPRRNRAPVTRGTAVPASSQP